MTSISGSMSPADRIQQMLQSAVTSGTVKSADQSALSSAITDIDASLQSGASTSLKPGDMKTKVDSLVDQEVTDGMLTSDQADELKQVFAQAAQKMGHHGGHHHVKASDDSNAVTDISSTDIASNASGSSSSTDNLTSSIENLMGFLKKLESATSSSTNYTASGASAGGTAQNLLANLFA